jgi:hypothetical protein
MNIPLGGVADLESRMLGPPRIGYLGNVLLGSGPCRRKIG